MAMVSQRPLRVNEKGKQIVTEGKKLAVVSTSREGATLDWVGAQKANIGKPSNAPGAGLAETVERGEFCGKSGSKELRGLAPKVR